MTESFAHILAVGGKSNSLGRANEVIEDVLGDRSKLKELYSCLFDDDAWIRMRAADALEKICRQHPDWLLPYIDRFQNELAHSTQPSIQWHVAQIYRQIDLTSSQKRQAISWLEALVATTEVDWIVSANVMETLVFFARDDAVLRDEVISLLKVQQNHTSNSVIRRATRLLDALYS